MSLSEDHLDPDNHLWPSDDDTPTSDVRELLRENCSGRWRWDRIDCCITCKDADLEPCGQQGIELVGCSDTKAQCVAHVGKTVAGTDACINCDDEDYEKRLEEYLEIAQEIVCNMPGSGHWSGDDWYISDEIPFTARLHFNRDYSVDKARTWASILHGFDNAVKRWDEEASSASAALNRAAGWADKLEEGER